MSQKGHVPIRTCIGCRKKKKKEEMIWLVQGREGVVWVNEKKSHQGRGFYLCPDDGCFNLAKKKNRRVGFLERMDLCHPSTRVFLIGEDWND
jgi:predicted RNA-binding protein YlxR (DUF448 family)